MIKRKRKRKCILKMLWFGCIWYPLKGKYYEVKIDFYLFAMKNSNHENFCSYSHKAVSTYITYKNLMTEWEEKLNNIRKEYREL